MPFQVLHYKPKKISQIRESDTKISIFGKVLEAKENSLTISDGSGEIEVFSEKIFEKGSLLRLFCSKREDKFFADIVQDLKGLDLNLYSKIEELYNRVKNV